MRNAVSTSSAPKPGGTFSQATIAGDLVFAAGQVGADPATAKLVDGGFAAQARQALANIKAVLEAAGTSMDNVQKVTVFITDLADFPELNRIYPEFLKAPYPARSTVQVAGLGGGAKIEVEAIATRK